MYCRLVVPNSAGPRRSSLKNRPRSVKTAQRPFDRGAVDDAFGGRRLGELRHEERKRDSKANEKCSQHRQRRAPWQLLREQPAQEQQRPHRHAVDPHLHIARVKVGADHKARSNRPNASGVSLPQSFGEKKKAGQPKRRRRHVKPTAAVDEKKTLQQKCECACDRDGDAATDFTEQREEYRVAVKQMQNTEHVDGGFGRAQRVLGDEITEISSGVGRARRCRWRLSVRRRIDAGYRSQAGPFQKGFRSPARSRAGIVTGCHPA